MELIKRAIYCIVLLYALFSYKESNAATITSSATGNWSNATTWVISSTRPGTVTATAGSTAVTGSALASFTTTLSVGSQILNTSNVVIGTVASIQSNTALTLVSGATNAMSNAGWNSRGVGPGDAVSIASGHTITVDGNYACLSIAMSTVGAQTGVTISGTNALTVNNAITMARPGATNYNCLINVGAGSISMGSLTMSATTSGRNDIISITTGTCTIIGTVTSGSTGCQITATSNATIIFGASPGSLTLTPGSTSTVKYIGSTITCRPATYNNLIVGGFGAKTVTSCTVNGLFQIDSITTIGSAITYGAAASIKYNTTVNRTVSSFEWPATFNGTGGVTISNTGNITLNEAKVLGNSAELIISTNGELVTSNFGLTLGGDFINSGTLTAGSSLIIINGTAATQNIGAISTTDTIRMNKTAGTATFTGNFSCVTLSLNGIGGTLSLGVGLSHSISSTFHRIRGTLLGGSSTLTISGNGLALGAAFTPETSTVIWNGAAQNVSGMTYYNIELAGSGAKALSSSLTTVNNNFVMSGTSTTTTLAALSIGGNFTIGNSNTFTTAAFNLTVTGTTTIGSGSGGTLAINSATPVNSFGNLTINAGGTLTNTVNDSYTISGDFINNGNYNSGTGTITFSGTGKSISGGTQTSFENIEFSGSYTLNSNLTFTGFLTGSGSLTVGASGTLDINSNKVISLTTLNASTVGNTVNYSYAGIQDILGLTYYHLNLNTSGSKIFVGNSTISGNLNLNNTANLDGDTKTITIKGNFTTSAGTTGLNLGTIDIVLDGNSTQTITINRTMGFNPKRLYISNSEKIFITNTISISDVLDFSSNAIFNGASVSTITFAGTVAGTGTFKFGSCASPSSTSLTISYNLGNIVLPNFESSFNQINTLTIDMLSNSNSTTINSDIIISNVLNLNTGVVVFAGEVSLDGSAPLNDLGGKISSSGGSLTFGKCNPVGTAYTIPNDIFTSAPTLKNLTINRTGGVTLGNQMVSISNVLTMSIGNLTTASNLTLLSTATNTARVAPIQSGGVIGNVIVHRFIPGGTNKRKWRLLSMPVNTGLGGATIAQFIDDILVTAPVGLAGNFDVNPFSPNNNASLRTYNEGTSGASSLGWTDPSSTNNIITTGTGMEVFVRGTRGLANPYLNWTTPDDVTIDFIGTLNSGSVSKTLSYTPSVGGATTADGFNLVGNPYASPINFDTTGWTKTNIENKFWCYNPNTSNYGIYDVVAQTGTNGITKYIASGQAFFVRANASLPSITFTENIKCKQIGNNYFKPAKSSSRFPKLRIRITDDEADYDEALMLIDSTNGTILPTDERDAAKFFNDALNIYTVTPNKTNLAINAIPATVVTDTINLSVWSYDSTSISTKHHKISFSEFESIDPTVHLFLIDKFLNVVTDIRSTSEYDFMITTDVNSYGNNRFKIVFNNTNTSIPTGIKKQKIVLYPNPANEKLYLQSVDFSSTSIEYVIYDLMGREIMSGNSTTENSISLINIDMLEKGNYLIRVMNNNQTSTMKFVKN